MKKFFAVLLLAILFLGFSNAEEAKLSVGVTIIPQITFVQKVAKDKVNVFATVPAGASPETYEPTPQDQISLADANIYFSIGMPIEETNVLPYLNKNTSVVKLHDVVNAVYPDNTIDEDRDPHIWLSPRRVMLMVEEIARNLSELDPANKDFYNSNAINYLDELNILDDYLEASLAPIKNRSFAVFHPAFSYFASDYNLEQFALQEHGKEATAQHMAEMIDICKERNIKVIFTQEEDNSKQAEAFAEQINAKVVNLEPLSADYYNSMKFMADSMVEALK